MNNCSYRSLISKLQALLFSPNLSSVCYNKEFTWVCYRHIKTNVAADFLSKVQTYNIITNLLNWFDSFLIHKVTSQFDSQFDYILDTLVFSNSILRYEIKDGSIKLYLIFNHF